MSPEFTYKAIEHLIRTRGKRASDMDHNEIEGYWKNFEIRIAESERDGQLFAQSLFENFMHDEPINKFIGDLKERKADFFMRANYYINDNLSLIAYEKLTGKVAAAQLSINVRKDRELPKLNYTSPTTSSIAKLCHEMELKYLGDEKCALDLRLTSTTREFRGQGLATEIYKRSINLAQSRGIPMVFGIFSSPFTCKITEKLGFEEMFSTLVKDVLNSETGQPFFSNAPQDIKLSFRMYRVCSTN